MKPAWPAEPTLSIPTLLPGTFLMPPLYILQSKDFFSCADMLPVKVFMSILYSIVITPKFKKNRHKTITIIICKTEYRENNSRFGRYAGNKTNCAAKLGT